MLCKNKERMRNNENYLYHLAKERNNSQEVLVEKLNSVVNAIERCLTELMILYIILLNCKAMEMWKMIYLEYFCFLTLGFSDITIPSIIQSDARISHELCFEICGNGLMVRCDTSVIYD